MLVLLLVVAVVVVAVTTQYCYYLSVIFAVQYALSYHTILINCVIAGIFCRNSEIISMPFPGSGDYSEQFTVT